MESRRRSMPRRFRRGATSDEKAQTGASMHYVWDFSILAKYSHLFWLGLGWTIAYTIGTIVLGTLLGLIVGMLRVARLSVIDWLLVAYIELFRCTPLLVQIIWFYYAFPVVLGVNIPAHVAAVSVLTLYGGAFYAEIVRGSVESVPRGQWDAGHALGLRGYRLLRLVILPQALKPMMAPYVNQSVTQLKNTSLVSVIAVPDLVYNATLINADTYRPLEVYTVVALIYFAILFPATLAARRLEHGMTYDKA
jgi:polar amino acid transport system permease protein